MALDIKGVTDAYLKRRGLKRLAGKDDDPSALVPFFVLGLMYDVYQRSVRDVPVCHEAKRYKRLWIEAYSSLNREFFSALTEGQQDEVLDVMDAMEQDLAGDVMIVKVALMEWVKELSLEKQDVIASAVLCNILAQVAQIVWGKVYKKTVECRRLDDIVRYSHAYAKSYGKDVTRLVDFNKSKRVTDAVEILQRKVCRYLV